MTVERPRFYADAGCPECDSPLMLSQDEEIIWCSNVACRFGIEEVVFVDEFEEVYADEG